MISPSQSTEDRVLKSQTMIDAELKMLVPALHGEAFGDIPRRQMKLVADNVTTVSLKECGHRVTTEQPAAFLQLLLAFLAG
jgi:pimeloyl-ACP methyl ester carboxylesterase